MANVLLVMGHRFANDEGDPEERRRTFFIVQAAELARRGPLPESAAVMEPAVLGCSAPTSVAKAEEDAESALAGG